MFAPAPSPRPMTRGMLRWSRTLTRSSPTSCMLGNLKLSSRLSAPASWPGSTTWTKTELRISNLAIESSSNQWPLPPLPSPLNINVLKMIWTNLTEGFLPGLKLILRFLPCWNIVHCRMLRELHYTLLVSSQIMDSQEESFPILSIHLALKIDLQLTTSGSRHLHLNNWC